MLLKRIYFFSRIFFMFYMLTSNAWTQYIRILLKSDASHGFKLVFLPFITEIVLLGVFSTKCWYGLSFCGVATEK